MVAKLSPDDVVAFWHSAGPDRWYEKSQAFDAEIKAKFGAAHDHAKQGKYDHWQETAQGMLGLIILLDQFARNIHRDSPQAFAADDKALLLAHTAIKLGFDIQVGTQDRQWFYLPFMHSEHIEDQELCCALCVKSGLDDSHKWAVEHADIIRQFGRFPHRNQILGRVSTPAEIAFLKNGGFAG
jgi:uncharacterized protein (DUF924 family)